jgi:2-keto-4-pentenoate hydratase
LDFKARYLGSELPSNANLGNAYMSLAQTFHDARGAGLAVQVAPSDFPADEAAVVAVQDEVMRIGGLTVGGWKAGPAPAGMQDTGCAPLAAQWTVQSGATVKAPGAPLLVESEFVLRFGKDVAPAEAPFTADTIAPYIDALAPGIELVWRRCANPGSDQTGLLFQADANGHAGMVLGAWRTDWQIFDLAAYPLVQYVNGAEHARGDSGRTMNGHPLHVAAALANRQVRLGHTIHAGTWVTTGSCTGALEISPGDEVRTEYGELGTIEVTIS